MIWRLIYMKEGLNKYGYLGRTNNQMTILLNRIQRQLGLSVLPLPDGLKKDDWANIIVEDTIPVFSAYIPHTITEVIYPEDEKDGWFYIDRNLPEGTRILGVGDIDWASFSAGQRFEKFGIVRYAMDYLNYSNAIDDISVQIGGTDFLSLFSSGLGVYVEWEDPNKIRLVSVSGNLISKFRPFPLKIYIEHAPSLQTISPTTFEIFTRLARADVATAIYQVLKYYDNMDTVYSSLQLQLDTVQSASAERQDIIRELEAAAVTTSNANMTLIMTV